MMEEVRQNIVGVTRRADEAFYKLLPSCAAFRGQRSGELSDGRLTR